MKEELNNIMEVLDESKKIFEVNAVKEKFYDMFIIDSLIGNTDRHNGNWGFIYDKINDKYSFSPIYDNGSCLNPMLDDEEIMKLSDTEIKNLAIDCHSCLRDNGNKINYMPYIKEMKNKDVNKAIIRVFNKIDMNKINGFIDGIERMSEVRRTFYKKIIKIRYDILKRVYKELEK